MTEDCRICGETTKGTNAKNLFKSAQSIFVHNIELLTGEWLNFEEDLPAHICICCEQDLIVAANFRDRCIRTQTKFREEILNGSPEHIGKQQTTKEIFTNIEPDEEEFEDICYNDNAKFVLNGTHHEVREMNNTSEEITNNTVAFESEYEIICYSDDPNLLVLNEDDLKNHQAQKCIENVQLKNSQPQILDEINPLPTEDEEHLSAAALKVKQILSKNKTSRRKYINWKNLTDEEASLLKRLQRKRDCICEQCGRHFEDPSNFKLHLLRHTGLKNYECQTCNAKFYTPHLLKRHKRLHSGIPLYRCQYCDKTFNYGNLKLEHERAHRNERPFQCNFCDKRFFSSALRKDHELVHTRIRKYHCEPCNQSFMRCTHLRQHQRSKSHKNNEQMLKS